MPLTDFSSHAAASGRRTELSGTFSWMRLAEYAACAVDGGTPCNRRYLPSERAALFTELCGLNFFVFLQFHVRNFDQKKLEFELQFHRNEFRSSILHLILVFTFFGKNNFNHFDWKFSEAISAIQACWCSVNISPEKNKSSDFQAFRIGEPEMCERDDLKYQKCVDIWKRKSSPESTLCRPSRPRVACVSVR